MRRPERFQFGGHWDEPQNTSLLRGHMSVQAPQ
jgi:hypothetical protein